LDFWGYSVVAFGVGRLLGIPTPLNFDMPLRSRSLSEFWTRWHISLGDFVRRRLYYPLQLSMMRHLGGERMYLVNTVSLITAFTFVGLWHRFTLPFVAWGVFFGVILSIEKFVSDELGPEFFEKPWVRTLAQVAGPIYTLGVIVSMLHLTAMAQMVGGQ
jgi:D-alanyl-lipoteichoic acid acyltransferase DltB (MBOAT superfamily)